MANKITYSISCTPIEEVTTENDTKVTTIASEVGKSLGCSGQAVVDSYNDEMATAANQGYLNQTVNYFEAPDDDHYNFSNHTTASFIFVKNTGHQFESATELGAPLERALKVQANNLLIATLNKGEGLILKSDNRNLVPLDNIKVRTVDTDGTFNSTGQKLAMEYLVLD
tara:strand:- start:523 stop:1029 length:507 start_codon:yes stop_codon:yes gene_type:complete